MKPYLHKIQLPLNQSFSIKTDIGKKFQGRWHYHPEIEVVYIREGFGTALIGNSIVNVKKDDLFILGSNLPHLFKSDLDENNPDAYTEAIVIHFPSEILTSFLNLPENGTLNQLLNTAMVGINIEGLCKNKAIQLIHLIEFSQKTKRFIHLLDLLNTIAESDFATTINNAPLKTYSNRDDETRLNKIYHYTLNNFHREITLKEMANIIYMTPHSFCRYFKSRTKKQYSTFLMEVRISHACKLLLETDYSVGVISFESGFMNLSNFNRYFKLVTGKAPLAYKSISKPSKLKNVSRCKSV